MVNHDMAGLNAKIDRLVAKVRALELSSPHNNSSVSRGAFQILSSEGLIVVGSEKITGRWYLEGQGWVTGTLNISGAFNVTGSSTFSGDSIFSGTLDVTGPSRFVGSVRVEGPMVVIGDVIFDGAVSITKTLDVTADARFRARVRVESDIELVNDGKFKAGPIEIDPKNHSGRIGWLSGQEIVAAGGALEMYSAGAIKYGFQLAPDGLKIPLLPTVTDTSQLDAMDWIARERIGGKLWSVPNNLGSPLGGDLEWPFDPETNTDEFGPRIHPITGELRDHNGMDFAPGEGADIRVAARGTVVERGTNPGAGFGYYLTVQHDRTTATLGAHMLEPSPFQMGDVVPKGAIIGRVGNTGTSTGAHYHFEVHINGTPENPRSHITKPYQP